jgi:hypothetical protein
MPADHAVSLCGTAAAQPTSVGLDLLLLEPHQPHRDYIVAALGARGVSAVAVEALPALYDELQRTSPRVVVAALGHVGPEEAERLTLACRVAGARVFIGMPYADPSVEERLEAAGAAIVRDSWDVGRLVDDVRAADGRRATLRPPP